MFKFSATILLTVGSALFAASGARGADVSQWQRVGSTDARCSFTASLDVLAGYPFARLRTGESVVVSLAVSGQPDCRSVRYIQTPAALDPPTFEVSGVDLCLDRLPTYSVTRFLSGVSETCLVVPER